MNRSQAAVAAWQNECDGWLAFRPQAERLNVQLFAYRGAIVLLGQEEATRKEAFVLLPPTGIENLTNILERLPSLTGKRRVTLRFLANDGWEKTAVAHNYLLTARYPLMSAPLTASGLQRTDDDISIRQVTNAADAAAVYRLLRRVFNDTMTMTRLFNPPELTPIFAAYADDTLVGSATLWPFANVAGVYSVATLPAYRKQGVATAVLQHLLTYAQTQGFQHAALRTIRPLFPVYEPLGFAFVGNVVNFVG